MVLIIVVAIVCMGSVSDNTWGADLDGQPMDFEMGDAIYRTLFADRHTGIYYRYDGGTVTDTNNHWVLHQGKQKQTVWRNGKWVEVEAPSCAYLEEFIHGGDRNSLWKDTYCGNYTVSELVKNEKN